LVGEPRGQHLDNRETRLVDDQGAKGVSAVGQHADWQAQLGSLVDVRRVVAGEGAIRRHTGERRQDLPKLVQLHGAP